MSNFFMILFYCITKGIEYAVKGIVVIMIAIPCLAGAYWFLKFIYALKLILIG